MGMDMEFLWLVLVWDGAFVSLDYDVANLEAGASLWALCI